MLKIIRSLSKLDFRQLMDVYLEGNEMCGRSRYQRYSRNLQLLYAEQDFYTYLRDFFRIPNAFYAVWIDGMRYVSALRLEEYADGLLLTALETMPSERKKGYATHLISAVLDYLGRDGNYRVYSHVKKDNTASVSIHLSCGFQIIADEAVYLDGTCRTDSYTLCIT